MPSYNALYKLEGSITVSRNVFRLTSSDIVSIAFIHNYDNATYPVIRVRIYADMETISHLTDDPDNIRAAITLSGNIYKTDNDSNTNSIVYPIPAICFVGKAYIENKNIPVSSMDHYKLGLKDSSDLNVDSKVPIELFVYDDNIVHQMRQRTKSVYYNTTVETVCRDIRKQVGFADNNIMIHPFDNQKKYDQILIPNMMAVEAFSFLDRYYGLYNGNGMLYCDQGIASIAYLTSAHSQNHKCEVFRVLSEKNNTDGDSSFIKESTGVFTPILQADNISILTETDIESVMNPNYLVGTNVNTLENEFANIQHSISDITPKQILHKYESKIVQKVSERIRDKITQIDLSAVGLDISRYNPMTQIAFVFDTPLRGKSMIQTCRIRNMVHVFTNVSGELFSPQTTMQLSMCDDSII